MEIRSTLPHASLATASRPEGLASDAVKDQSVEDAVMLGQYTATGLLYKMNGARIGKELAAHPQLDSEPRVAISRPFVLVPGWTTKPDAFQELGAKLTEGGANGGKIYYVKNGEFFVDPETREKLPSKDVPKEAKVFQVVARDIHESPSLVAEELDRDFEAIRTATGASRVDVEAYSMGGLSTRIYLDRGGQAVGKLLMLGTPNRGTRFAELARHVIHRDVRWAMSMGGISLADLPALSWLAVDDSQGRNPLLQDLNSRWPQQASRVEAVEAVGGQGQLTPATQQGMLFAPGDGLVPTERLAPPGEKPRMLPGELHHSHLNREGASYKEMTRFFGWTPLPGGAGS